MRAPVLLAALLAASTAVAQLPAPKAAPTPPAREAVPPDAPLKYTSKPVATPVPAPAGPVAAPVYMKVPPGEFLMGCADGDEECDEEERPAHRVKITKGFEVATTEATVGQYRAFAAATKSEMPGQPEGALETWPVSNITWHEAGAFCRFGGGRLPTEAEWEYAARAGETRPHYGDLATIAVYGNYTQAPVATKKPNAWGLFDVLGNVWEWCADGYSLSFYERSPEADPKWESGQSKVLRGGAFLSPYGSLRLSARFRVVPDGRAPYAGVRCVRDLPR